MPYNIQSSAIGAPYDFLTATAILEFVFDCLVAIASALYNLAEMVYEAGVKLICNLTNSVLSAIQETVTKIVNAFQAFVAWAVSEIERIVAIAMQPFQSILESMDQACRAVSAAINFAENERIRTGLIDHSTLVRAGNTLTGDLFLTASVMAIAIVSAIAAINFLTAGFGFLMVTAITIIATVVIEDLFGRMVVNDLGGQLFANLYESFISASQYLGLATDGHSETISMVCSVVEFAVGTLSVPISAILGIGPLIISIIALTLGTWSWANNEPITGRLSMGLGLSSLFVTWVEKPVWSMIPVVKEVTILSTIMDGTGVVAGAIPQWA